MHLMPLFFLCLKKTGVFATINPADSAGDERMSWFMTTIFMSSMNQKPPLMSSIYHKPKHEKQSGVV